MTYFSSASEQPLLAFTLDHMLSVPVDFLLLLLHVMAFSPTNETSWARKATRDEHTNL